MAEDKSAGVEFVATITGFDADGGPVNVSGSAANRVLAFNNDYIIAKDTSVNPNVIRISSRNEVALTARIAALEAKRFSITALKSTNYTAASWDHVLVDMDAAAGDLTVTLPSSPAVNDRVKIVDISQDGGYGGGRTLKVSCTFAIGSLGNWASSPFSVAYSVGNGGSSKGASIELVYIGTGWIIDSETCSVAELL